MAFSNCSKCGKPSNKILCDNCIAENKYKEERNVANRLNELAAISRQDYELAAKETLSLMERPPFSVNDEVFWDQVRNESFLEDCYYKNKLGSSFKKDTILNLPDYAFKNIPNWFSKRTEEKCALLAKSLYDEIYEEQCRAQEVLEKSKEHKRLQENAEANRIKKEAKEQAKKENAKKVAKKTIAISMASLSTIIFFCGLMLGGAFKLNQWIDQSSYWFLCMFGIIAVTCCFKVFLYSKDYANEILDKNYYSSDQLRLTLRWSAILLFLILTIYSWNDCSGVERLIMLAFTAGLHFIPYVRGILGSLGLGVACGLGSLLVSYLIGGLMRFFYMTIMA
jgi:hypothetical protein